MQCAGISIDLKDIPVLDPNFIPFEAFTRAYLARARKPVNVAIKRNNGQICLYETQICGGPEMRPADRLYMERLVKFLLWQKGGYEIYICGDEEIAGWLAQQYEPGGLRQFDAQFMSRVFEMPFAVRQVSLEETPSPWETRQKLGGHLAGCRIGFDAGGSDRKVSAVIDGKSVYSEEIVWFPKVQSDPEYHYEHIVTAFKTAAAKMPRVDAVGVSSAGIYIDNQTKAASLFRQVPEALFKEKIKDIYIRAACELGEDIPLAVANDGDVTALAGAMSLEDDNILGIAMGTSEAVGFVADGGAVTGWLNELAFAPVDLQTEAAADEWSGALGVGSSYFSQDAAIRLAGSAGIDLDESLSLAEKLKEIQRLMDIGDPRAAAVFETVGCYLGHTIPLYYRFYKMKHVLLLGRLTSDRGGELLVSAANRVLASEYPEINEKVSLKLPDEKSRRVGQSVAAASLPQIGQEA